MIGNKAWLIHIVTSDLSEVNKDKYEEKVQELANELDKEVPKIGKVKLLMKLTFRVLGFLNNNQQFQMCYRCFLRWKDLLE